MLCCLNKNKSFDWSSFQEVLLLTLNQHLFKQIQANQNLVLGYQLVKLIDGLH